MLEFASLLNNIASLAVIIVLVLIFLYVPSSRIKSRYKHGSSFLFDDERKRNIHRVKGNPWP
jgi:hypothetical protein